MKRIFTFLYLLCIANSISAQNCANSNTVCAGETFEVCKTNYTQSVSGSDYALVLMLTAENSATIIQSSGDVSGAAQACYTFDAAMLSQGTYQVRALNYDVAAAMNVGLPVNTGDNVDAVGAIADVCYNPNFLNDVQCYEVVPLPMATADCSAINEGALVDVTLMNTDNAADVTYAIDNGAFQSGNQFVVTAVGSYILTAMNTVTGCTFDFEVTCTSLPLELTAFEGACVEGNYVLNWETGSEEDISHFVVERSTDGVSYVPVGEVAAAGHSTSIQNYAFKDETGGLSRYYYRLHIIETTGVEEYSRVVTVECKTGSFGVLDIHPNPTNEAVVMTYEAMDREHITLKIADVLGRRLHEEILAPDLGLNTKMLDLSGFSPAVYVILMDDGVRQIAKRVVRE